MASHQGSGVTRNRRRTPQTTSNRADTSLAAADLDGLVIELIIQQMSQELRHSTQTLWETLKEDILSRSSLIQPSQLDGFKSVILDQLSKGNVQQQNSAPNFSPQTSAAQRSPNTSSVDEQRRHGTSCGDQVPPPEIDNELTERLPPNIAIWARNKWQGAFVAFGTGKDSFVHRRIVERHGIDGAVDDHIFLTWCPSEDDNLSRQSYETSFTVYGGPADKYPDFVFGTNYKEEESGIVANRKALVPKLDVPTHIDQDRSLIDYNILGGFIVSKYNKMMRAKQGRISRHMSYKVRSRSRRDRSLSTRVSRTSASRHHDRNVSSPA
ncbi:hypothetical protein NHQ30_000760 [Ciborinia camelliae]|nr:hypothetical protein NHQ30_000760 [Ciborinia camelliae]